MDRIARKIQNAAKAVPAPIVRKTAGRRLASSRLAAATRMSRGDRPPRRDGIALGDFMRVRGFPFGDEVAQFLDEHEVIFVVEQNRDGQLRNLLETGTALESSFRCATTAASR